MGAKFVWYELMTSDVAAAVSFYQAVVGWTSQSFSPGEDSYIVMKTGEMGVGGVMAVPPEAAANGLRPAWVGYVYADDVDAATADVAQAGGTVHRRPWDIPNVGRLSVVSDPQGAMFNLMKPDGPDMPLPPPDTIGRIGWHELFVEDWPSAFKFYSSQFGWTRGDAIDIGPMGTYQLFNIDGGQMGGIMTKPKDFPRPCWNYYFNVSDIDAAAGRVGDAGGQLLMGPH